MKFLFLTFFLIFSALLSGAERQTVVLPPGTPVFRTIDLQKPPALVTNKETECQVEGTILHRHQRMPLMQDITFYRFRIPGQGDFWAAPQIAVRIDPEKHTLSYEFEKYPLLMLFGGLCALCAALLTVFFFRNQTFRHRETLPYAAVILFFYGIMLYLIGGSGNIIQYQADDFFYFRAAKDIAEGNFTGPWNYTVGLSLFYLPFQLFMQAETLQEFYPPFLLFNCFIVTPFALCMCYRAIRKLSSSAPAFCTILLWLVMTLLYHHRYSWTTAPDSYAQYVYRSLPALPELTYSYSLYELYTFYGYNCVSDTVSMALVFACIASALCMRPGLRNLALVSALYGLACLVRVNNLLFTPLLMLILYLRYAGDGLLSGFRPLLRVAATGAAAFLAIFSIQLAVDWLHFGNPFTLPYILHAEDVRKGFSFSMAPYGMQLLCISNHAWFVTGTLAWFFISSRMIRALLAWWIFPLVFFFFGYPMVFNHAARFILPVFPALAAAFVLMDFRKSASRSLKLRIVGVVSASVFLTAPAGSPELARLLPWNLQKYGVSPVVTQFLQWAVLTLSLLVFLSFLAELWKNRMDCNFSQRLKPVFFLGLFLLTFYWANPYVTAFLMLCAFLKACQDTVSLIRDARPSTMEMPTC